ncbi:MAG: hypothetical protein COB30_019150 [Ectothiorhodospiraceae bacterium]|nr:hypothetical protein [Ectothiorhodospiraceae bacterium]
MRLIKLKFICIGVIILCGIFSTTAVAGEYFVSGKITSLLASAKNPAIRIAGNISPSGCNGGTYGWLYFVGTAEERNRVYASALALSLAGKTVTAYTNSDGGVCQITNIQVTNGLN